MFRHPEEPAIEISRIPPAGEGSEDILDPLEGRVAGAKPGERIVLFSRSGKWWVQPFSLYRDSAGCNLEEFDPPWICLCRAAGGFAIRSFRHHEFASD